ncbi:MAG: HupE/UreJ family protein [Ferruginibacter sp.]
MNDFTFYFTLGWQHIISLEALDHILFIMALSAVYSVKKWQPELIVLTAFTVCHSITLALSVYDIVRINSCWVEFLIPVTIIATAVFNLFQNGKPGSLKFNYLLAMFFV